MRTYLLLVLCLAMGVVGGAAGQGLFGQTEVDLHSSGDEYYTDVAKDSPHADDIGFAREAGIARGFSATEYGPTWNVPREQMATFEMRSFTAGFVFAIVFVDQMLASKTPGGGFLLPPEVDYDAGETWEEAFKEWDLAVTDMMLWAAELVEYEAGSRGDEAVGPKGCYGVVAKSLRSFVPPEWWAALPES